MISTSLRAIRPTRRWKSTSPAGPRSIAVPAVTLDGASDTLTPRRHRADYADMLTARHEHRVIDSGHNSPQEARAAFADTVLTV
jgi:pimeloyl-ACP methyl ester carboxylesterase